MLHIEKKLPTKNIKLEEIAKKNLEKRQKVAKIFSDLFDFLKKQLDTSINQNERHPK